MQSLAFAQMNDRYNDIAQGAAGTCEWLLQHETYKRWAASDRSLLWLKGKPGSGKSTLLRDLLNRLKAISDIRNGTLILSFFFHGRGTELQKTPLGLFRSLLHQLQDVPHALSGVVSKFKRQCQTMGIPGQKWEWHRSELQDSFEVALLEALRSTPVLLLVDALDECGEKDARELVKVFVSLLNKHTSTESKELRICFTCRHYPVLSLDHVFEIWAEKENDADISVFVNSELSASSAGKTSMISDLIASRANGIFLWAYLVVKQVLNLELEGVGLESIKAAILSVPRELDKLYSELIQRMGDDSRRLIQWICFAVRPLSVDEMRWALLIQAGHPHRTVDEHQKLGNPSSDDEAMERRVQTLSCGLAEVSSDAEVVQFIHQSVKDFFHQKGLSALALNSSSAEIKNSHNHVEGFAHYQLSRTCLHYLALIDLDTGSSCVMRTAFPLLAYAAMEWMHHAKMSWNENYPVDILRLFAWPSEVLVQKWVDLYRHLQGNEGNCPANGTRMIHVLSQYGFKESLLAASQSESWINTEIDAKDSERRTALTYAAEEGYSAIVRLLVENGAEIDAVDITGRNALSYAVISGDDTIVKLLIENDANVDMKCKYDCRHLSSAATSKIINEMPQFGGKRDYMGVSIGELTPLCLAAMKGDNAIVELLVMKGASIEATDIGGRTALCYAAMKNRKATAELLLLKGACIDVRDRYGRTALCLAAMGDHTATTELLLLKGASVNITDEDGRTALCHAAMRNYKATAELLLLKGASVDIRDKDDRTTLCCAAEKGLHDIVKYLLNQGSDTKAKDKNGHTALWWAAISRDQAVFNLLCPTYANIDHDMALWWSVNNLDQAMVTLLRSEGANIDHVTPNGRTFLSYAAERGDEAIVQLLLRNGASVQSVDELGRTPLSWAAGSGCESVVLLLLTHGADAQLADGRGQPPLWYAVSEGRAEIVQLFLGISIEPKWTDDAGRTLLRHAVWGGSEDIVQALLDRGANINFIDDLGRTLLSSAAEEGHYSAVRLLLEHGADTKISEPDGRTPLLWAAIKGRASTLTQLLDKGADMEFADEHGRTALSFAAWKGHHALVKQLLDNGADVNTTDKMGRTPLWYAEWNGSEEMMRLLLDKGAEK